MLPVEIEKVEINFRVLVICTKRFEESLLFTAHMSKQGISEVTMGQCAAPVWTQGENDSKSDLLPACLTVIYLDLVSVSMPITSNFS